MERTVPPWIASLLRPAGYDHPVDTVELVETHASWVLLAGEFAYKIKKPVDFGFLDFSTLEKRRHFCHEELRLNRRTAPELYLAVVPIGGDPQRPVPGGEPAIDYAVKMRRFPQECQFDRLLAAGRLEGEQIERFAEQLAAIHEQLAVAAADSGFGTPQAILAPIRQNFDQLRPLVTGGEGESIAALERWSLERFAALEAVFLRRREQGRVRECHGDVHLGNIVWLDGAPVLFDGIEFNANFRWIDLVNDYAFLVMDLDDRGNPALGWRFLNRYLRSGGDYAGLELLRFYQVYRALVRAKVAFLRLGQETDRADRARDRALAASYLSLAAGYTASRPTPLLITHGFSGSGKSSFVGRLAPLLGAVILHSDVERKRLHGLAATQASGSPVAGGIYGPEAHLATYARLQELAATVLNAGLPAIVDATFLRQAQREQLCRLARQRGVPFAILDCRVPEAELRRRVAARGGEGGAVSEATLAVLERQFASAEPLTAAEVALSLPLTPDSDPATVVRQLARRPVRS